MSRGTYRGGAPGFPAVFKRALVAAAGSLVASGCTTSGMPAFNVPAVDVSALGLPRAESGAAAGTVAFEWMDGVPDNLKNKLIARLQQETNARKIVSVSYAQPSQYRIKMYMAAIEAGQKTTITWVWDVSTADHRRVARFTGEVPGAPSGHLWAAADDAVISRIVQNGMSELAAFLANSSPHGGAATVASASGQGPMAYLPASRQ